MTQAKKSTLLIISLIVFIDLLGFGIVFPLLPVYIRDYGLTESQLFWIIGIYSLMQFVFAPILGQLSDRIGRRPVLLVSLLGTALSFFMLAWSKSFWWFFIARALDGIAGSNLSTAQAYIADVSPKEERTRNLGMCIGAAFGLGFAFGPFFGGLFHWIGTKYTPDMALALPFLAAGTITLVNTVFAFFKLPESIHVKDSAHAIGRRTFSLMAIKDRLLQSYGPLIWAYAIVIFAFALMEVTISLLAMDYYYLDHTGIYMLFGYLGLVVAFGQGGLVRRLAPKHGDRQLAVIGCLLMAVSLFVLPFSHQLWWLYLATGVMGIGQSLAQPSILSSISKSASESLQGETMGVTQSLASMARFLSPALAALGFPLLHLDGVYYLAGIVMLRSVAICLLGFRRIKVAEAI